MDPVLEPAPASRKEKKLLDQMPDMMRLKGQGEAFAKCWMTFSIPATTRVIES